MTASGGSEEDFFFLCSEANEGVHSQAEYEEKETREGQFEIACRELHLRREATAADSVSFEDFGKQVAAVFSQLQEYFHRFCQKVQDTPICGGCVEKARILDFEIVFEGMSPFQKMSSECNHFSRSKKMYRFVPTSLSTGALGAFRKYKVV